MAPPEPRAGAFSAACKSAPSGSVFEPALMRGNGPRRVAEARPIIQHRRGVVITTVHEGNGAAIRDKEVLMPDGAVLGLRGSLVCFPARKACGGARGLRLSYGRRTRQCPGIEAFKGHFAEATLVSALAAAVTAVDNHYSSTGCPA
jgi:hypothetical protein